MRDRDRLNALDALFGLSGRVALVTGASSGIGAAIARELGRCGADVVLLGRSAERLALVRAELVGLGAGAEAVTADLADRSALAVAAEQVVAAFGEPDILVNAAGLNSRPPLGALGDTEWDATIAVNLTAPFLLGRRFGPTMAARGWGRIVNIGSQQTFRAFGNSGAYGVAKAGLAALTRSQAEAWSPSGVCVNTIVPGFVHTAMTEQVFADPARAQAMADRTMVGRNGVPDDLVGAAVFLCGPAATFITGQAICVDGGFSVH